MARERCVYAGGASGACSGSVQWHHPIEQNRLKREFPYGAMRFEAGDSGRIWRPATRHEGVIIRRSCEEWLTLSGILRDARNRMFICDGHHEPITNHRRYVVLPASVWEFARDFGLVGMLENDLARARPVRRPDAA